MNEKTVELNKICPIRSAGTMTNIGCCKERCAWWDGEKCGILSLADHLQYLTPIVDILREWMGGEK